MFLNNLYWQSRRIIIFMCKCYKVLSDTLVGFFLMCSFFVVILLQLYEKPRRNKDWVTEENIEKFVLRISVFWRHVLLSVISSCVPPVQVVPKWRTYWMTQIKKHIAVGGILCNVEKMKIFSNIILTGWHP